MAFRYQDEVNGSARGIAGILNDAGNVLGMMPHPERALEDGARQHGRPAAVRRPAGDRRGLAAAPDLHLVAARFAGRKHAHEDPVGTFAVDDDDLALERFGIGEDDDRRRRRGLCGSEARQTGNRRGTPRASKSPVHPARWIARRR